MSRLGPLRTIEIPVAARQQSIDLPIPGPRCSFEIHRVLWQQGDLLYHLAHIPKAPMVIQRAGRPHSFWLKWYGEGNWKLHTHPTPATDGMFIVELATDTEERDSKAVVSHDPAAAWFIHLSGPVADVRRRDSYNTEHIMLPGFFTFEQVMLWVRTQTAYIGHLTVERLVEDDE